MSRDRLVSLVLIRRWVGGVLQDLRANRGGVAISTLSMILGVVAVVLTSVAGVVARDVFVAREEQRTARAVTYACELTLNHPETGSARDLADLLAGRLRGQPVDYVLTGETTVGITPPGGTKGEPTAIVLYDGDYPAVRRLPVLSGRWPGGAPYPPSVVVNRAAADTGLGAGTLTIDAGSTRPRMVAQVAAVIADGDESPRVYMPWGTARALLPLLAGRSRVQVLVHAGVFDLGAVEKLVSSVAPVADASADRVSRYDTVPSVEEQLRSLQAIFLLVAVIALAVSALGIVNLGLATVAHRSRELSIRRAVGARRLDLFGLVVGSSLVSGLLAAAIAVIGVGVAIQVVLPRYIPPDSAINPPTLPWAAVLVGCLAACGTALIGATFPAIRASRVDIASVLRD